jgi:hypothetical protein
VLEVLPHPLGLPGSAGGRFYARSGDETRPLDYREVQRRFASAREATEPVRAATIEAAANASRPIQTHESMRQTTTGGRQLEYEPFSIGIAPTSSPWDLGMTGRELLGACAEAAEAEHAAYLEIDRSAENLLYSGATTVVGGVIANSPPDSVIQYDHSGVFGAAHTTMRNPFAEGAAVDPRYVGTLLARFSAVGLLLVAATAGPTSVYVSASSGSIPAVGRGFPLPALGSLVRPSRAKVGFLSDARGAGAVAAVAEGSRVLKARTGDAAVGTPAGDVRRDDLDEYLNTLLA